MHRKACPICGERMQANPRYPHQVCQDCVRRACDEDGRSLLFYNTSLSGGLEVRYAESGGIRHSRVCYIDGLRCQADEAHLGGIVLRVTVEG
ncbi:MAG: hypothetical protein PVI07_13265 [Anaerolineae bacterium]|jgi:hypothetical protein